MSRPRGTSGSFIRCPADGHKLEARGRPEWRFVSCTFCAAYWTETGIPSMENPEAARVPIEIHGRLARDVAAIR